jgi:6-phosphogluconolactonase (cycloisomerase 2 family)
MALNFPKAILSIGIVLALSACGGGGGGGNATSTSRNASGTSRAAMAQSYVPRFAYMANQTDGTVSAYTVNDVTGQLRGNGYVVTQGGRPTAVAVDSSGRLALVTQATSAGSVSNVVSVYTVNSRSGALAPASTVSAGIDPSAIAIDQAGRYVFVANYTSNDVSAYALDRNGGTLRPIPCVGATCNNGNFRTGTNPRSVVIDPRGRMVLVVCADRVSPFGGSNHRRAQ